MNLTPAINMRHHGKHLQSLRYTSGTAKPQAKCLPQPAACHPTLHPNTHIPISEYPLPLRTQSTNPSAHTLKKAHTQPAVSSCPRAFPPPCCAPSLVGRWQAGHEAVPQGPPSHLAPQTQKQSLEDGGCRECRECRVISPMSAVPYVTGMNKNFKCAFITTFYFYFDAVRLNIM